MNYYPWVGFVVTSNDTIWSDDLQNEESVVYVNVKKNFEDAVSQIRTILYVVL